MIDDFRDAIDALNRAARHLLEDAHQLDDEIAKAKSLQNLDKLKSLTTRLCKGMQSVVGLLGPQGAVLDRFFKKTKGVAYTGKSREALEDFLNDHEAQLRELGASEEAIAKLKRELRGENKDAKRTVEPDGKLYAGVKELQQLICNSAEFIEQVAGATDVLKGCVKGAMGVATIVIDITGVLTIPDITGIIIFKAVKSTVIGGNMVRKAIGSIKKGFKKLKIRPKRIPEPKPEQPPPPQDSSPRKIDYPKPTPEQREKLKLKPNPKPHDKDEGSS